MLLMRTRLTPPLTYVELITMEPPPMTVMLASRVGKRSERIVTPDSVRFCVLTNNYVTRS